MPLSLCRILVEHWDTLGVDDWDELRVCTPLGFTALSWCRLSTDDWAAMGVNDWADMDVCAPVSSSSSSSSSSGPFVGSPRVVVQNDGAIHPRFCKDYPFVETVAGGEQSEGSVDYRTGALLFRVELARLPSIAGMEWRFELNYMRHPEDALRVLDGLLGPDFEFPQMVYVRAPYGVGRGATLFLRTAEFTEEAYFWDDTHFRWVGEASRSIMKLRTPNNFSSGLVLIDSHGTNTLFRAGDPRPFGMIEYIIDRYGNTQHYSWSENFGVSKLDSVVDPYGRTIGYTYERREGHTRLTGIEDHLGRKYTFQYDAQFRLVAVVGPSVTHGVTPSGTSLFPNGTAYVFEYGTTGNQQGRLSKIYFPNQVEAASAINSSRVVNTAALGAQSPGIRSFTMPRGGWRANKLAMPTDPGTGSFITPIRPSSKASPSQTRCSRPNPCTP